MLRYFIPIWRCLCEKHQIIAIKLQFEANQLNWIKLERAASISIGSAHSVEAEYLKQTK